MPANHQHSKPTMHARSCLLGSTIRQKFRLTLAVLLLFLVRPTVACGPSFPNSFLMSDERAVSAVPPASFQVEIDRIVSGRAPLFGHDRSNLDDREHTDETDLSEIAVALEERGLDDEARKTILERVRELRQIWRQASRSRNRDRRSSNAREEPAPEIPVEIPAEIPPQFHLYLQGARAFHQGDLEKAAEAWNQLLALPEDQRRQRTTWATYMLGRIHEEGHPERSIQRYQQVRERVEAGFVDPLGLAVEAMGREARLLLRKQDYVGAIKLYLLQYLDGSPDALSSLTWSAQFVIDDESDAALRTVAADADAQAVVTAHLLCGYRVYLDRIHMPDIEKARRWASALEVEEVEVAEAARLAWLAYRAGERDLAQRWLDLSSGDEPIVLWLQAKLALWSGNLRGAADSLAYMIRLYPQDDRSLNIDTQRLRGELGMIELGQAQFLEALDILVLGEYWVEAAYIAERILNCEELRHHVEMYYMDPPPQEGVTQETLEKMAARLRYLLARRMIRAGDYHNSRRYLPAEHRGSLARLSAAAELADDFSALPETRADAYWEAAWVLRHHGMELIGTELDPDWKLLLGGSYTWGDVLARRSDRKRWSRLIPVSDQEKWRAASTRTEPYLRFHYRYLAAESAWNAAALMPDGDPETARRLCVAGRWLIPRDNAAADRFYKAMVNRCGDTELGREADRLRWFPRIPDKK